MKKILRKFDTLYVYNNPVGYPIHKSRAAQPFLKGYWEVFCFVDLYRLAMSNFCWDICFLWLIETRPRLPNWVRSLVTSSRDLQLSVTLRFSQLQAIKLLGIKYKYGLWKKNCKV